jgi:mRNA-degrading endonuclease toxin of MazEF toxin-antitoxin module
VIIIQNDVGNRVADMTIIAAISTNLRPNPTNVLIKAIKQTGLKEDSMVKTSQLLTISKERLLQRLGKIDKATNEALKQALKISLSLD